VVSATRKQNTTETHRTQRAAQRQLYFNSLHVLLEITIGPDRTFFKRNNRWVDANALKNEAAKPDRVVEFGSQEFYKLVDQLVREGREGILALSGELLLVVDGKTVLIKALPK